MIQINEQQLDELKTYLLEIPAKYANPILNFFTTLEKEQNPQTEVKED